MTLDELSYIVGQSLKIETNPSSNGKAIFFVSFRHAEIKGDGVLISVAGNGTTLAKAKKDYAKQIAGKQLVFNAWGEDRREYNIPTTLR